MNRTIYKVILHGVGFKQEDISGNSVVGFYTTFGVVANDMSEIKEQLSECINSRMQEELVLKSKHSFLHNSCIIEGVYSGNEHDLDLSGFTFYKANLISRIKFVVRRFYLYLFDPIRILKI